MFLQLSQCRLPCVAGASGLYARLCHRSSRSHNLLRRSKIFQCSPQLQTTSAEHITLSLGALMLHSCVCASSVDRLCPFQRWFQSRLLFAAAVLCCSLAHSALHCPLVSERSGSAYPGRGFCTSLSCWVLATPASSRSDRFQRMRCDGEEARSGCQNLHLMGSPARLNVHSPQFKCCLAVCIWLCRMTCQLIRLPGLCEMTCRARDKG